MGDIKTEKKYGSLRNNLIYSYLLLGIVPLVIVSLFSYQIAKSSLVDSVINNLVQSSTASTQFIDNWFSYRHTDLHSLAESKNTVTLLKMLIAGFNNSGLSLGEYVKSDDWIKKVEGGRSDLLSFSQLYGYVYDFYIIDIEGNILYSVAEESDLGTNIINGPYSNTNFSESVKNTLKNELDSFSSFERYKASNNLITGFITTPIVDHTGDMLGVFSVQLKTDVIYDHLTNVSNYFDKSMQSVHQYLTDEDGVLISPMHNGGFSEVLKYKIDLKRYTEITKSSEELRFNYNFYENVGLDNKSYLGLKRSISVNNIDLFLICEIEYEKAFSSIVELGRMQILFVSISALIVIAVAYYRSGKIVKPISELTKITMDISSGEMDKLVDVDSKNEIGQLADNFNLMQQVRLEYERSLIESREKTNQALDDLNQQKFALDQHSIVAITDVKGTITFVNDLFSQVSGYSKQELIGKNHRLLKSGVHDKKFFHNMFQKLTKGETFNAEICNRAKGGHFYWVDTTIVPYMNKAGKPESYISIRTDITKQKQVSLELMESKNLINKALDDLNQQKYALDQHSIVAITDVQGTITFVNDLFTEVSGYRREELIGQNHRLLKSGKHDNNFFRDMFNQLVRGKTFHAEICNKAKDGHLYWVDTTIVPFMNDKGKPESYIAIRTDITKQKQVEVELIKSRDDAEKAVIAKSEFLASMSHEIRTPMNGVLGMLGLLINSKLDEDQLHRVKIAQSSGQALLSLINDILDFSKIEADKLDLEIMDFNLRGMLGEFAEAMAYTAQSKGLELILDVTKVENSMVKGDSSRLRQILTNIVGNAIKFTSEGEIVVRAEIKEKNNDELFMNFEVSDTGIGIPDENLSTLFESFSQVDTSTTRKFGGTGLGLAIARKLCVLMGGDIAVESVETKGSVFKFSVILEKSLISQQVLPNINIKKLNILIVDDNITNCEVLREQLEHWGANVIVVNNAKKALEICDERINNNDISFFDVALIDMQMPDMDGEKLGKEIRSDSRYSSMKLVMMTSMGFEADVNKFSEMGFSAYFPKPATTSDLFDALAVVVDKDKVLQNTVPLVTRESLQVLTHEKIQVDGSYQIFHGSVNTRILLVEDNHVNQLVAQGILSNFNLKAEIANNGLEALYRLNLSHNEKPYDLILMDCQMPEMDGYEASRSIRAGKGGEQYINIPIIAMTANAMQGDREKCISSGMSDYLTKPIDSDALLNKLNHILMQEYVSITNDVIEDEKVKTEMLIWDKAAVLQRLLGKEDLLKTVIDIFTKDIPERISEMQHAINNKDCELVCRIAHSIKGVAANLSAIEFQKIASDIESSSNDNDINKVIILFSDLKVSLNKLLYLLDLNSSDSKDNLPDLNKDDFQYILNNLIVKLIKSEFISAHELKSLQNTKTDVDSLVLKLIESINDFDNSSAIKIIKEIENVKGFKLLNNSDES